VGSACPCLALCPAQKPRWSPLPKILGFGGSFLLARPPPLHLLVSRPCHHRIPACLLRLSHPRALVPPPWQHCAAIPFVDRSSTSAASCRRSNEASGLPPAAVYAAGGLRGPRPHGGRQLGQPRRASILLCWRLTLDQDVVMAVAKETPRQRRHVAGALICTPEDSVVLKDFKCTRILFLSFRISFRIRLDADHINHKKERIKY
jgi:hypothetical protein